MKKVISIIFAIVMTMSLVACGSQTAGAENTSGSDLALKIAIVSSPSGVDDGSFNEDIYNGILKFIESNPKCTVTPVQEPTGDVAASLQAVADIVADYDVIVCGGFQFAGIATIAQENPDKKFILVDAFPSDADGQEVLVDNIYAMQFAEQESGFFAGMAAALATTSNKVAVVNGIAFPSNVNYQYGFECGVKYINSTDSKNVEVVELPSYAGTDVTGANVDGNYIGDFNDEATGKVVGNALISEGCDVMFVAAGNAGNGVFTAAKEASGVYIIGCDTDQYDDGVNGDSNIILTSGLKVMHSNVTKQLENIAANTFKGANEVLTAGTDSTGYVSEPGRHQLSDDAVKKLDAAFADVKAGKIVPAANFNGITPETFTW